MLEYRLLARVITSRDAYVGGGNILAIGKDNVYVLVQQPRTQPNNKTYSVMAKMK